MLKAYNKYHLQYSALGYTHMHGRVFYSDCSVNLLADESPVFNGVFEMSQISAGGSIGEYIAHSHSVIHAGDL